MSAPQTQFCALGSAWSAGSFSGAGRRYGQHSLLNSPAKAAFAPPGPGSQPGPLDSRPARGATGESHIPSARDLGPGPGPVRCFAMAGRQTAPGARAVQRSCDAVAVGSLAGDRHVSGHAVFVSVGAASRANSPGRRPLRQKPEPACTRPARPVPPRWYTPEGEAQHGHPDAFCARPGCSSLLPAVLTSVSSPGKSG